MRRAVAIALVGLCCAPGLAAELPDRGIWPELDSKLTSLPPPWLSGKATHWVVDPGPNVATLCAGALPLAAWPCQPTANDHLGLQRSAAAALRAVGALALPVRAPSPGDCRASDRDRDGVTDWLDAARGAAKTALNAARYEGGYIRMDYPGGDVPREIGVCTDVVVRAYRNAGFDLQREVHVDMKANRARYGLRKGYNPDRHIEHRRVRRLLPYFRAHHVSLPTEFDGAASDLSDAWLPGDVVFFDTLPDRKGPDHVGVLSGEVNADGVPLVINNWTDGFRTQAMDLVGRVPITHRFRLRRLLARSGMVLQPAARSEPASGPRK